MNEGFRNLAVLLWALCAVNSNSYASDGKRMMIAEEMRQEVPGPTIIYGASKKASDESDEVVVEQPAGAPNPLGNPIPEVVAAQPQAAPKTAQGTLHTQPTAPVKTKINPDLGKDFQNTVLEANDMVYDIQAFPEEDLKAIGNPANPETIYSPNVNPY